MLLFDCPQILLAPEIYDIVENDQHIFSCEELNLGGNSGSDNLVNLGAPQAVDQSTPIHERVEPDNCISLLYLSNSFGNW